MASKWRAIYGRRLAMSDHEQHHSDESADHSHANQKDSDQTTGPMILVACLGLAGFLAMGSAAPLETVSHKDATHESSAPATHDLVKGHGEVEGEAGPELHAEPHMRLEEAGQPAAANPDEVAAQAASLAMKELHEELEPQAAEPAASSAIKLAPPSAVPSSPTATTTKPVLAVASAPIKTPAPAGVSGKLPPAPVAPAASAAVKPQAQVTAAPVSSTPSAAPAVPAAPAAPVSPVAPTGAAAPAK